MNHPTKDIEKPGKWGNMELHALFLPPMSVHVSAYPERLPLLSRIRIERILTAPLFISNGLRESSPFLLL